MNGQYYSSLGDAFSNLSNVLIENRVKILNNIFLKASKELIKETKRRIIATHGPNSGKVGQRRNTRWWPKGHKGSGWKDPNYETYSYAATDKLTDAVQFKGLSKKKSKNYKGADMKPVMVHILGKNKSGDAHGSHVYKFLETGVPHSGGDRRTRSGDSRGKLKAKTGKGYWTFWKTRRDTIDKDFAAMVLGALKNADKTMQKYNVKY